MKKQNSRGFPRTFESLESRLVLAGGAICEIGAVNKGVAVRDGATGSAYIMFSEESVFQRFASFPPFVGNSDHLVAVRHISGQWQYNDNNLWRAFTPDAVDRLLAAVDLDLDTIVSLQGETGSINGIEQGYVDGDLTFAVNIWNGSPNLGEFLVDGTYFEIGETGEDPDDQLSEASPILLGSRESGVINGEQDVDMYGFSLVEGEELTISVDRTAGSAISPALRLFDDLGNELASGVPTGGDYVLNAGTLGTTTVSPSGAGDVSIDLDARKIASSNVFYIDDDAGSGGDGSMAAPFRDIDEAISQINADGFPHAILNAEAGRYSWGETEPFFDMMLVGAGRGQTIIEGTASTPAAKSRVNGVSLYIDSVTMRYGDSVLDARNGAHLTLVDSEFADSNDGDGVDVMDFETVVVYNTWSHRNWRDGFSYHNASGPMEVLEFEVRANDNGRNDSWTSQGSTTHETTNIVRVRSEYLRNPTNIGDVSSGTSWNVDITASDATDSRDYNFYQSGTNGEAWLISGHLSQGGIIRIQPDDVVHYTSLFDVSAHTFSLSSSGAQLLGADDSLLVGGGTLPVISYTATTEGDYYVGVSGSQNVDYDPLSGTNDVDGGSTGGYELLLSTTAPPSDDGLTFSLGDVWKGVGVRDAATGTGYIMFTEESVYTRFSENPPLLGNSYNLIAVRNFGGQWQYNDNNLWQEFTPQVNDRLLASVDFSSDTIASLQGATGQINGIDQGYLDGDLTFTVNIWNGSPNPGEFLIDGTFFTV